MRFLILSIMLITSIGGCTKLPESFGVYCYNKSTHLLTPQKIKFNGNISEAITGLSGPSGLELPTLNHIIVYEKDINPKQIKLVKLTFTKIGTVQNIVWQQPVEVNLWTKLQDIEIDIVPIDNKKDMYKIIPKSNLANGFYAIHYGGLEKTSTIEAARGNNAYDFVIGSKSDYLSYGDHKAANTNVMNTEVNRLLAELNKFYNAGDFEGMKGIYRPQGRLLTGTELTEFIKGQKTWKQTAGNIIKSEITSQNISDESGRFELETKYSSKGIQKEKLIISNIDGRYYITSLD